MAAEEVGENESGARLGESEVEGAPAVALVAALTSEIEAPAAALPAEPEPEPEDAESEEEQIALELRSRQHVQLIFERKGKVDEAATESLCQCLRRKYLRSAVAHELNMMRSKVRPRAPRAPRAASRPGGRTARMRRATRPMAARGARKPAARALSRQRSSPLPSRCLVLPPCPQYPLNRDERSFSVLCQLIDAATQWCHAAADYQNACAFLNLASTFYRKAREDGAPPEFVTARMRCGVALRTEAAFWEATFNASLAHALHNAQLAAVAQRQRAGSTGSLQSLPSPTEPPQPPAHARAAHADGQAAGAAAGAAAAAQPGTPPAASSSGALSLPRSAVSPSPSSCSLLLHAHSAAPDGTAQRWRELAEEQRSESLSAEQSIVFGQLGFFAYTMLSLGVDGEEGRQFVRKMCVLHNLQPDYSALLLDVMQQYPNAHAHGSGAGASAHGARGAGGGAAAAGAAGGVQRGAVAPARGDEASGASAASGLKAGLGKWTAALLTAPLEPEEAEHVEKLLSGAGKRMSAFASKTRQLVGSVSTAPSRAIDKLSSASASHASRQMSAKLYKVGLQRYKAGAYHEAEELFRSALRINEREMGPLSEELGVNMNNLAAALEKQDKLEEAHAYCQRARAIFASLHGAPQRCCAPDAVARFPRCPPALLAPPALTRALAPTPGAARRHAAPPSRAGETNARTAHVDSKLHEIEAAIKSQPGRRLPTSAHDAQGSLFAPHGGSQDGGEAEPVHLLPPGAFLSDHSLQQHGVESYLRSAVDGLLEAHPGCGEMWVPASVKLAAV